MQPWNRHLWSRTGDVMSEGEIGVGRGWGTERYRIAGYFQGLHLHSFSMSRMYRNFCSSVFVIFMVFNFSCLYWNLITFSSP